MTAKVSLQQKFNQLVGLAQSEIQLVIVTIREKGWYRFARLIGLGLFGVYFSYALVYAPAAKKMAGLQYRVDAARATAQYADDYKALRDQLDTIAAALPPEQEGETWLLDHVRGSLNEEGLVSESLNPPTSQETTGFTLQDVHVRIQLRYPQLLTWLHRLESFPRVVRVSELHVSKVGDEIGVIQVECKVSTLIPRQEAR